MALEIERKFLVNPDLIPGLPDGTLVKQGYIGTEGLTSVRARIKGKKGFLTIKGESSDDGLSRQEFEYEIPLKDSHRIIDEICDGGTVEKRRYELPFGGLIWEVDVFEGANRGLVMAEVELPDADTQVLLPEWADEEVTGDVRYYNMKLAVDPWKNWGN